MRCPRCNSYVKYGRSSCRKCGLHFRYSEGAESACKRSTAAIFARVGGIFGLHDFYLGYFAIGAARAVIFAAFIGLYLIPQLVTVFSTGMFRVVMDFVDVAGLIMLVANIISYVLAIIESMRISCGIVNTDSKGLMLK